MLLQQYFIMNIKMFWWIKNVWFIRWIEFKVKNIDRNLWNYQTFIALFQWQNIYSKQRYHGLALVFQS